MILQGVSGTTRLLVGMLLLLVVLFIVAAIQVSGLNNLSGAIGDMVAGQAAMRAALSTRTSVVEMESGFLSYLRTGERKSLDQFRGAADGAQSSLEQLRSLLAGDPGQAARVESARAALVNWRKDFAEPAVAARGKKEGTATDSNQSSGISSGTAVGRLVELKSAVFKLAEAQTGSLEQFREGAQDGLQGLKLSAYIGFPLLAILVIASYFLLSGLMMRPIAEAASMAEALKQGVLTHTVRGNGYGEAGKVLSALDDLARSLKEYNKRILEGVDVLSNSANQIGTTASQLYGSASQTVSAVGETTSIVREMEGTASVVNENAGNVATQSRHSDTIASAGARATKDTIEKMSIIKDKMEIVSKSVVTLSENTKFVEHIISAVQDLADQSNLLAVNASIEAARAGEHGKGFAVVAHEIKSLADQSRNATERVSKILQEIRKSVSFVVMATEEGSKAVQSGLEQSEAAGQSIDELAGSIKAFSQAAGVIFSSSEKQFARVERVSTAMRNVEIATSQSMEGTSHLETEARKLEELGLTLRDLVQQFSRRHSGEM